MAWPGLPMGQGSLLDRLLGEQQELTAVEAFSRDHSSYTEPAQARYYSRLLPASPPGPGEQYAFEVDLDRCSGCKACVTACHSLNGLDEQETWRDVGLLIGGTEQLPVIQHVTAACHHCVQPACMTACPVNAYEKDSVTGIVKHLDDQCFGCQYCTLACPYNVPKYHARKGIVRKCDMCSSRLSAGEAPACVQACPHEAIRSGSSPPSGSGKILRRPGFFRRLPIRRSRCRRRCTGLRRCFRGTRCRRTITRSARSIRIGRSLSCSC